MHDVKPAISQILRKFIEICLSALSLMSNVNWSMSLDNGKISVLIKNIIHLSFEFLIYKHFELTKIYFIYIYPSLRFTVLVNNVQRYLQVFHFPVLQVYSLTRVNDIAARLNDIKRNI